MKSTNRLLERVRKTCLSLPECQETSSWGHPNFRAGKRTFVALEWIDNRPSIAFRQTPTDIDLLLARKGFFATPYGRGQWVSAWADVPTDWSLIQHLLERSYRLVALKRMVTALDKAQGHL